MKAILQRYVILVGLLALFGLHRGWQGGQAPVTYSPGQKSHAAQLADTGLGLVYGSTNQIR